MNPLLFSQTNRESFVTMCTLECEANTNSFYEPHFVLQNTSENIDEKEAGKVGAEFPPDPLSAPIAFRSSSLKKNWRDDLSVLLSHHGSWVESLWKVLKIWLRIFFKESSNFVQKTQPTFTFYKIIRDYFGMSRLVMVFFRYNPGIFEITGQRAVGNAEVPALKRRENEIFRTNLFSFAQGERFKRIFL